MIVCQLYVAIEKRKDITGYVIFSLTGWGCT